jgi:hypothetical protein
MQPRTMSAVSKRERGVVDMAALISHRRRRRFGRAPE